MRQELGGYSHDVARTPTLSKDEEQKLGELIRAGRQAAEIDQRQQVSSARSRRIIQAGKLAETRWIEGNLRLVLRVAQKYSRMPVPLEDLVQEGNLGLMHAIEKFDWNRGTRFSTYAIPWIHHYISRAVANQSRLIRIPVNIDDAVRRVARAREMLGVQLGRPATSAEVAARLKLTVKQVEQLETYNVPPMSMDGNHTDNDRRPADIAYDGGINKPREVEALLEPNEPEAETSASAQVAELLATVNDKERPVLELLYGLGDNAQLTREEAAKELGCQPSTVRRIERGALKKLREAAAA